MLIYTLLSRSLVEQQHIACDPEPQYIDPFHRNSFVQFSRFFEVIRYSEGRLSLVNMQFLFSIVEAAHSPCASGLKGLDAVDST